MDWNALSEVTEIPFTLDYFGGYQLDGRPVDLSNIEQAGLSKDELEEIWYKIYDEIESCDTEIPYFEGLGDFEWADAFREAIPELKKFLRRVERLLGDPKQFSNRPTLAKKGANKMKRRSDYQGWTNYETWSVTLLWDNEQGSYLYWNERAYEMQREFGENASYELAEEMEAELQDNMPEMNGLYQQLLGGAIDEVNWKEVADHYLDGLSEFPEGHFSDLDNTGDFE